MEGRGFGVGVETSREDVPDPCRNPFTRPALAGESGAGGRPPPFLESPIAGVRGTPSESQGRTDAPIRIGPEIGLTQGGGAAFLHSRSWHFATLDGRRAVWAPRHGRNYEGFEVTGLKPRPSIPW